MTPSTSDTALSLATLWYSLGWPLLRLLLGLAVGLMVANLLEALRWTRHLARLASPLARAAHLRDVAGASFSLAFVSPAAANGLLSDSPNIGELSNNELMLANLFNSLPAYLVHTPTIFLLTWPVLGTPALVYVALVEGAGKRMLAIEFLLGLIEEHPTRLEFRKRLSDVYIRNRQVAEAVEQLDLIADAFVAAGNRGAAISIVQAIIALNPPNVAQYYEVLNRMRNNEF